jgi:large subunit ribosomal protein L25
VKGGGVLVHAMSEVNVEAFPQDIPHSIDVDLAKLVEIDDSLYVRDLVVDSSKVKLIDDGDELLVRVVPVRVEEEAKPAAAAAEGAEAAEGEAAPAAGEAAPAAGAAKPGAAPAPGAAAPKPGAATPPPKKG